ncbi:MAG: TolC family protein [Salinibacter sp.]
MAVRFRLAVVLLIPLCFFSTPAASQQGPTVPSTPRADTAGTPVPCRADDCPVLELDAFLRRVLRNSPQARSLRLAGDRAAAQLLDARGGFGPRLVSGYEYKTKANKAKLNVLRSGLRQPLNLPMSPTLTVDYRRGVGSSADPSVATSRVGETRIGVSLSPLAGLFTDKRRAALDKARLAPRRARAQQAKERNKLLRDATHAFWDWVGARRKLDIARDLLELARRRETLITRQARAGEVPAIDSVEARRITAGREGTLADAVRAATQKRVTLATFLWGDEGAAQSVRYAPPPVPSDSTPEPIRTAAAVDTALARRPTLRTLDVKQRQARIEQSLARSRLRPNLKLKAQAVSYNESPLNVTDVKVGLEIEQPLFFRQGRSDAEKAQIKTRRLDLKQDIAKQKVRADVEAAVVALRQARRRARSARRSVALARRLRAAEQRRFDQGQGTLFRLNQREKSLASARRKLVSARIDVLRARATYRWATGTIADPYRPR